MKYVELGRTGERVSPMCLGTMMFGTRCDEAEADRILGTAIEQGINFIDTAPKSVNDHKQKALDRGAYV